MKVEAVLTPGDLVRVIHARKLVDDPTELVFSTYAMHGKVWITTDLPLTVLHVSREPMDAFVCCRHGLGWLKSEDLTGWE